MVKNLHVISRNVAFFAYPWKQKVKPSNSNEAVNNMKQCIDDLRCWMVQNHLKLNESKTEYLLIGSASNIRKTSDLASFQIGSETIISSPCAKNIGAVLDSSLCLVDHVNSVTRACYYHLHRISKI